MANAAIVIGVIMVILAVILIATSAVISGILSVRQPDGDTKSRLLGSAAISSLAVVFAITSAVLGILYGGRKAAGKNVKGLGIAFLVVAIITFLMFVTIIALNITVRQRPEIEEAEKNALTAGIILVATGLVSLTIGAILLFAATKKATDGKGFKSLKDVSRTVKGGLSRPRARPISVDT